MDIMNSKPNMTMMMGVSHARDGMIIDNDLMVITLLVRFYLRPALSSALFQKLNNDRPLITTLNHYFSNTVISQSSFSVNIFTSGPSLKVNLGAIRESHRPLLCSTYKNWNCLIGAWNKVSQLFFTFLLSLGTSVTKWLALLAS